MIITYCFEYAQTEKSKCTECNKIIKRNGLRIGELSRFSKKVKKSQATYRWWHFDCFKMVEKILDITPEKIRGYDKLTDIDKQRIKQLASLGVDSTWNDVPEDIRNDLDKKAKTAKKAQPKTSKAVPKTAPKTTPKPKAPNTKKPQQPKSNNKNDTKEKEDNDKMETDIKNKQNKPKKIIKKAKTSPATGGLNENKINDAIRQLSKKLNNKNKNNNKKPKAGANTKKASPKANNKKVNSTGGSSTNDAILDKLKKKIQNKNTKIVKKKKN